jgi:hypothetical protein
VKYLILDLAKIVFSHSQEVEKVKSCPEQSYFAFSQAQNTNSRWSKIVNLRFRVTLRYHNLPIVKMTNDMVPDEKVLFQGFRRVCTFNSCLSTQPKMRFGGGTDSDVEEEFAETSIA